MSFLESGRQFFSNIVASSGKYHGLLNQGATCYLNSVLQVLFMTEDFREAVERHTSENPDTECIDHHLTTLFDDLKGHPAYTYNITKKLGIDRVYEQRDAAEYYEKILRLTSPEASQIFHGLLTHKTICSVCRTVTDTDGAFWHLPLALLDSPSEDYSVVNGIEEYFRALDFSGENQMYCDQCDAKSDATVKCVIKRHPEVLMLLLKRFEFNYDYMTHVKINCSVDVPCTLQIPENQTYELYAVVEHFGDLRSGHYTATIKSQDDERWYSFNDATVTSLGYQLFQVDDFKKSSSAYLVFYRKKNVHAANTCTQDIGEVSIPGGFPSSTSDIHDQTRKEEEVELAAEAGNDTAVAVSIDRKEEIEIKDTVSDRSRGVGLSPDLCYNAEDQGKGVYAGESIPNNNNKKKNDLHYHLQDAQAEKQRDEGEIIIDDKEDMGGNAEADDLAEKRETLSREAQLEDSVENHRNYSGRLDDVRQRTPQEGLEGNVIHSTSYNEQKHKQEVSNMHARCDYPQQVQQRDKEMVVMDISRDMDGKMAGDELSERRVKASTKYLDRDAEQDYDLKPVSTDKQRGEEMMETDVKVNKEGNTGVDERGMASGSLKLSTKYDLCYYEIQDSVRVGNSKQNMSKYDQRCEHGGSSRYKRHEQQREEKRDVKGDKDEKRGDDKHPQRRETSMTKSCLTEGVEDQDNGDDVRQRRPREDPEQKISVTRTTHKDVGVDKLHENKGGNEHIQDRADSYLRRAGSAGSRRLTENQGVGSVEKPRQGDSQPKARTGINEDTMEERQASKKSRICHVKIIEEEFKDGIRRSSETINIRIETEEGTSQGGIKSRVENNKGNVKRKSDRKTDAKVSLSERVGNLKLSEVPLRERQKRKAKRVIGNAQEENETNSTIHSIAKKKQKEQAAGMDVMKKRGAREKKRKRWQNKTPGCLPFNCKSQKNAEQTSESD